MGDKHDTCKRLSISILYMNILDTDNKCKTHVYVRIVSAATYLKPLEHYNCKRSSSAVTLNGSTDHSKYFSCIRIILFPKDLAQFQTHSSLHILGSTTSIIHIPRIPPNILTITTGLYICHCINNILLLSQLQY